MSKLALIAFSIFALIASPAMAKDGQGAAWTVSQLSGDARVIHPGLQPVALKANARLSAGDVVATGVTGRATLARGADYVIIAPRSELRLPAAAQPGGFTRVMQRLGTILFKVQHTGVPHFAVDTPMLAAVVKGTTFTVVVDDNRSAVQVIQGTVEVTATDGGMKSLVEGGRTVFINHSTPKMLIEATPGAPAPASSTSAVKIIGSPSPSVASIADVTGGLVRADVTAQPVAQVAVTQVRTTPAPGTTTGASPAPATPGSAPPSDVAPVVTTTPVSTPTVSVPGVTTPTVSVPGVTTPTVTIPGATTPTVTVPGITTPTVTVPVLTTPTVTVPVLTTPTVTVPVLTTPTVAVPVLTTPTVTVPSITTPTLTVPVVTTPIVTVPAITTPVVTVPTITVPVLTVPTVKLPPPPPLFGR